MKWPRLEKEPDASGFELLVYCLIWGAGISVAGVVLFLGKVFAAMMIGLVCMGLTLRFKRGRIRKP